MQSDILKYKTNTSRAEEEILTLREQNEKLENELKEIKTHREDDLKEEINKNNIEKEKLKVDNEKIIRENNNLINIKGMYENKIKELNEKISKKDKEILMLITNAQKEKKKFK